MIKKNLAYFLTILSIFLLQISAANAQTLFETLEKAYHTNPELKSQRTYLKSLDEGVADALSGFRPNISASANFNNVSINGESGTDDIDNELNSKNASINFSQSLYEGMRTINQTRMAKNNVLAGRANLLAKEQEILLNAATAFLDVARDRAVLSVRKNNETVLERHFQASKDRFSVGEITKTDVSQSNARYLGATAMRIEAEGQLQSSIATYLKVIGDLPKELKEPNIDKIVTLPKSFEQAKETSLISNPLLKLAKYNSKISKNNVSITKGGLLPSVSFIANAKKGWDENNKDETLDTVVAGISVSIPLYTSGSTRAKIRKAKYIESQSKIDVRVAETKIIEQTQRAWENYHATKSRIKSIVAQIKATSLALDGVEKEAQVGSRTVLDVLDARQEHLDARVSLIKAKRQEMVAAFNLLSSMGKLTAKNIKLNVKHYSAQKEYNKTKDRWISTTIHKQ